ncbi:SseB family protein [Silvimonas amylolytica]|uniref:SseB family protein n=1 Tax=Silvimonas amylolytica TaxID=449663 RepID=UPI0016632DA6
MDEAIEELTARPSSANRIGLYRSLKSGHLILGAANLPQERQGQRSIELAKATTLRLLTSSAPDGGTALLAFTSHNEVTRRNPALASFGMESTSVLQLVLDQGFSGLVINPQGSWAGIPRQDIQDILEDKL